MAPSTEWPWDADQASFMTPSTEWSWDADWGFYGGHLLNGIIFFYAELVFVKVVSTDCADERVEEVESEKTRSGVSPDDRVVSIFG